jgi:hypothetical protein
MKTIAEKIAVMQAFVLGKAIQSTCTITPGWVDCTDPAWNWGSVDYRIKPEPREWLVWVRYGHKNIHSYNTIDTSIEKNWKDQGWTQIKVREVLE